MSPLEKVTGLADGLRLCQPGIVLLCVCCEIRFAL